MGGRNKQPPSQEKGQPGPQRLREQLTLDTNSVGRMLGFSCLQCSGCEAQTPLNNYEQQQ